LFFFTFKRKMKKLFLGLVALSALFSLTNCSDDDGYTPNPSGEIPNIVETAIEVDLLDSLVAALMKADEESSTNLVQTLSGDGPFTVFAPTNDAFTALLESLPGYSSLEDFDTDAEKRLLAQILSYHVLPYCGFIFDDSRRNDCSNCSRKRAHFFLIRGC
jgi:uncharacterized surface protein with fasciclin (FAS1) repeats